MGTMVYSLLWGNAGFISSTVVRSFLRVPVVMGRQVQPCATSMCLVFRVSPWFWVWGFSFLA